MFPLYDETHQHRHQTPVITLGLIFLNTIIFFFTLVDIDLVIEKFGMMPQNILQGVELHTIFTAMFLHGGFAHLIGNMWFLWVFGDNLESELGKFRFLIFYLLCGALSAIGYCYLTPDKTIPTIGASGAIAGILGGYLVLFPRNQIRTLVPIGFFMTTVEIPAVVFLFVWLFYQFFLPDPGVATGAHVIGFFVGALLVKLFQKR
ncbi:MAG TPA: rhomboid family intramembrane serine protease [Candidatus Pacearchaeota archaeon]|nr:rhomboid family intramembrane serine protease [Candidatus Pacearchaeota archaeon]HPO75531.1 rhomboid family intramembrane serine protease [Candidatus Pacearchaeota archaeon]